MRIWLDDTRDPTDPRQGPAAQKYMRDRPAQDALGWRWVTTAAEAIRLLSTEEVEEISLDHDLGATDPVGTGNDVLVWIEEAVFIDEGYWPPILHVHSGNQSAREKMDQGLIAIERRLADRDVAPPPPGLRRPPKNFPQGRPLS